MRYSVEETIARVAAAGYRGVEILADVPHAWPVHLLPERKRSIREHLQRYELQISNINAFMMNAVGDPRQPYWHPGWTDPDPHYRAIRREHTLRSLHLAGEFAAPSITTEPGGCLAPGQSHAQASAVFYEELMPCVELAERLEVDLLLEPEPGLLIERFDQYLEFVDRLDTPRVGLNFDIGHAFCVGEDPAEWIGKMAAHTRHFHLEDIAASRVHAHLIPGQGAIDFPATLRAIQQSGYDGWVTVELYPYVDQPDAAAAEARAFLLEAAQRASVDLS